MVDPTHTGVSLEAGKWRYTAVCVRNLPLTAGCFALIFPQALVKDKSDCCLH